jgi:hypothetical protein
MYFILLTQSGGLHRSELYLMVVIDEGSDIVSNHMYKGQVEG